MACVACGSEWVHRDGRTRHGQRWRCFVCRRRYTGRSGSAFSRHRVPDEVIGLAVRWYVRFRLSYADVAELLAERGIMVNRSTVYRWVQRFLPSLHVAARRHRQAVGVKWRVDETYCRLSGRWAYCYRAIDEHGQVVDVFVSERRNATAARCFFERAIDRSHVEPQRVTTDRAAAYQPALRQVLPAVEHRCSKYLNNGIERDHQHLKQRLRPMRGFKRLHSADTVTRGHALVQNLRNGFSGLTARLPRSLRLATAFPQAHGHAPVRAYNADWCGLSDRLGTTARVLARNGFIPTYRELHLTLDGDRFPPAVGSPPTGVEITAGIPHGPEQKATLCAICDGEQVGVCVSSTLAHVVDGPAARRWGYVHWLHVATPWRRRGLARHLLTRALATLAAQGCTGYWLTTGADNWPAQPLCLSLGFEIVDTSACFAYARALHGSSAES